MISKREQERQAKELQKLVKQAEQQQRQIEDLEREKAEQKAQLEREYEAKIADALSKSSEQQA